MSGMGTVRGGRESGEKCWGNLEREARAAAAGRRARTGCDSPLFFDDIFVRLGQDRAPTRWRLRVRFVRSERLPCEGDEPAGVTGDRGRDSIFTSRKTAKKYSDSKHVRNDANYAN